MTAVVASPTLEVYKELDDSLAQARVDRVKGGGGGGDDVWVALGGHIWATVVRRFERRCQVIGWKLPLPCNTRA